MRGALPRAAEAGIWEKSTARAETSGLNALSSGRDPPIGASRVEAARPLDLNRVMALLVVRLRRHSRRSYRGNSMRRAVAVLLLMLAVGACDPGWVYTLPDAKPLNDEGVRYSVEVGKGVRALFSASVFTSDGGARVEVVNESDEPVSFDLSPTIILDAAGQPVADKQCATPGLSAPTILRKGDRANIRCGFHVNPSNNHFFCCNEGLRLLTLSQPGFSQSGRALPVKATMKWDRNEMERSTTKMRDPFAGEPLRK